MPLHASTALERRESSLGQLRIIGLRSAMRARALLLLPRQLQEIRAGAPFYFSGKRSISFGVSRGVVSVQRGVSGLTEMLGGQCERQPRIPLIPARRRCWTRAASMA